jgi:hypothetical protein
MFRRISVNNSSADSSILIKYVNQKLHERQTFANSLQTFYYELTFHHSSSPPVINQHFNISKFLNCNKLIQIFKNLTNY